MAGGDAITTVLFDAAGTLFGLDPSLAEFVADELSRGGFHVRSAEIAGAIALVGSTTGWPDDQDTADARIEAWRAFLDEIVRAAGLPTRARTHLRRLARQILAPGRYRVFPDVLPSLGHLADKGHRVGIVSNFDDLLFDILRETDLARHFEMVVTSHRVGTYKPDPAIFRHALERIGSEPGRTAYVGDSIYSDIRGSAAAGLRGILLDRENRHADFVGERIPSLDDLALTLGI
jgi:HAD superfamily hydrolase (TIGR01509 family)